MNTEAEQLLLREVHVNGANRAFGELTLSDVRAHAAQLRAMTGWGPTIRVMPVAHAWHELAAAMERAGVERVSQLDGEDLQDLAPRLWVLMPSGAMMK